MKNFFIIKFGAYPFDVFVSIDEPDSVLLKRLIKYGNLKEEVEKELLNLDPSVAGRSVLFPSCHSVIRLVSRCNKHEMISIIVHESFHTVTYLFNKLGMELKLKISDESYAYCIGFLSSEICKKLKI